MESNEFDGAFKRKAPPRAPRRRQAAEDEDPESSVPTAGGGGKEGVKKSGWGDSPGGGDDTGGAAPVPRRRRSVDAEEEETSAEPKVSQHAIASIGDDEEPTAFIPDLEDEEADLGGKVAVAPSLKSSRVQTIDELDEEIDMALPSASEVGVDLSVLQSFLTPQEQVQEEEDVPWDFEHELQTIGSELRKEAELREGTNLPGQASPKRKAASAEVSAS